MLLLLWLWLLFHRTLCLGALQPVDEYRPSELVKAALHVLESSVGPRFNALSVMELSRSDAEHPYQRRALTYLLRRLNKRMAVQLLQDKPIEQPRDHILFLVDTPQAFRALHFQFATTLFDREFNFLILLSWRVQGEQALLAGLHDIFAKCLRIHVLNAVVLVESADPSVVHFYGYRLYAPDCNVSITPELVNRYAQGQLLSRGHLFGRALRSFYGCPLTVSWYPLPPFVMFTGDREDPQQRLETWRLTGVDGELLKLLGTIFKFRLRLLPPCEKKTLEHSYSYSADDCFHQLGVGNSSVAIGALSASHLHRERFSTTCSYHQSALVFVVRTDHYMGAVNQLVQPFCGTVWLALILSCLAVLLLQWAWRRRSGYFDLAACALRVHTTLLGNPLEAPAVPRAGPVRCYLGAWLLLALVQRVAYQGKLYDVFRLPYYPPVPEHIAELLEGDYQYLSSDYVDYFPQHRTQLRTFNYLRRFEELEAAEHGTRLTTSALLGNLAHYNHLNWQHSRLTHVREHIYLYQLVMYLRRHSIFKFAFDRKLKQLQSAGIVGHINRYFEHRMQHEPYAHASHEVSPIRQEMFCGLYFIYQMMLLAALFVFFLELISLRVIWLRRYFL
ncbi:uncharacterized protein LOC115768815 [Drosophila novamexicana]|uniref:uncharacterized protein LOC115768815 n=1 Tax=Drosophila novamexicana TaxID=47314 RepID=UPI0011E5C901|nr:uncharacterized protein LOC115768815 [Drosophila novamexicana]